MAHPRGYPSALVGCLAWLAGCVLMATAPAAGLQVGAATAVFTARDDMVIAGGIGGAKVQGQEGQLRAVATVVGLPDQPPVAWVACDVLFVTGPMVQAARERIHQKCGLAPERILINATHTHSAPSTARVHGYDPEPDFVASVVDGIAAAVEQAHAGLQSDCRLDFRLGEETTVGQNSRLMLADRRVFWVGSRDDAVGPTGPFDPQLPVLALRRADNQLVSLWFNHSTHTIGAVTPNVRSPAFYGLAAQQIEQELGGVVGFLEGASGSTHNLSLGAAECQARIVAAVRQALSLARPVAIDRVRARSRPFEFHVRVFDEAAEEAKVVDYCRARVPAHADAIIPVFRQMRQELKPQMGTARTTEIQALVLGPVAVVGVPAEFFTVFGLEIKRRSPFPHTIVAELANDWIGYLPDREAHSLGGYQTWMGLHSYAEIGTGERVVDEAVALLEELARE